MKTVFCALVCLGVLMSCQTRQKNDQMENQQPASFTKETAVLKVYVDGKGQILSNNSETNLKDLDDELADLKGKNGVVYYSRYNTDGEPPGQAMEVIELVVKHELPLKFFTDATFNTPAEID